ncbi:MAG: sigma-70 family RNA polymerase sigma factor [Acidimicrobiales bacterium]
MKHIVFQVAVHFPRHVDRDELARAGALGLVEAARRYDEDRGCRSSGLPPSASGARSSTLFGPPTGPPLGPEPRPQAGERRTAAGHGARSGTEQDRDVGGPGDEPERAQPPPGPHEFGSVVLALEHETADDVEKDLTLVDVLVDHSSIEPSAELETRELHGYLRDAISLLPERHRLVVVGYFLEGRTSQELADFLGVTESRISQLRSESLLMLQEGIEAQYLSDTPDPARSPGGWPVARPPTRRASPRPPTSPPGWSRST